MSLLISSVLTDLQLQSDLRHLFETANADNSDVAFCLHGTGENDRVFIVYAHKTILRSRAHGFLSAMQFIGIDTTRPVTMHLQNIDPTALSRLLRYVYTGRLPDFNKMEIGEMQCLVAVAQTFTNNFCASASRCPCKEMKLIAETEICLSGFGTDSADIHSVRPPLLCTFE